MIGEISVGEKLKWPRVFGVEIEMIEMAGLFGRAVIEMLKWRGVRAFLTRSTVGVRWGRRVRSRRAEDSVALPIGS